MKEFMDQKQFAEYLKSIGLENPFDCSYLRVLPEKVFFNHPISGGREYNPNSLMCIKSIETEQNALTNHYCYIIGRPLLNSAGNLEINCNWGEYFKIKIEK